ncbi:hypothetical protein DPMN_026863 [Dreissena polymorpha]|uniref:C2H2-type domain-containing protein n=1 Tax=Dreissena polymorpha TaxID=45954 RepID=A0A9D4LTD5_DREPO|nr:hypothetical protein DPMN_026863 [Dreissena polymorpha]
MFALRTICHACLCSAVHVLFPQVCFEDQLSGIVHVIQFMFYCHMFALRTICHAHVHVLLPQVCFEDQLSVEALKVHLRTHLADNTLKCLLCHFNCDNKEDFESHMFMQHDVQLKVLEQIFSRTFHMILLILYCLDTHFYLFVVH